MVRRGELTKCKDVKIERRTRLRELCDLGPGWSLAAGDINSAGCAGDLEGRSAEDEKSYQAHRKDLDCHLRIGKKDEWVSASIECRVVDAWLETKGCLRESPQIGLRSDGENRACVPPPQKVELASVDNEQEVAE